MAVSLNANFMRSDYMLSDAALPLRLEEMEQAELMEQGAKFAEILGGIGDRPTATAKADIPEEQMTMPESEQPMQFDSVDELAQAVASGEIQLSDVPKELITKELLTKIAELIAKPEQADKPLPEEDEAEQQAVVAEFVAAYAVQENVTADKSAELSELAAAKANTAVKVDAVEVKTEAMNVQPDYIPAAENAEQTVQTEAQPVAFENVVTQQAVEQAATFDIADEVISAEPKPVAADAQPAQPVQQNESSAPVQQPTNAQQAGYQQPDAQQNADTGAQQQSGQPMQMTAAQPEQAAQPTAEAQAVEQTAYADAAKAMSTVETRTIPQPAAEETAEQPVQQFTVSTAAQPERVISKESELSMIKEATRPAVQQSDDTAEPVKQPAPVMAQPMTAELDTPVTFPRAEGGEVEVRPSELLQQVADKVIDLTEQPTAEGGTEYKVTLTPEDLGTITVKMTKTVDGSVTVSITADNARTQRILEEHSALIQANLRNNGVELENWQTVSESQQEPYAEDYNGSSRNPYHRQDEGSSDENAEDISFAELIASM